METCDCRVLYFASVGTYYWCIAVAKPVSHPLLVGSQAKLFPSLNRRPGALEMRARCLPVLWTLAFYWFNLSPAKLVRLRASRRRFNHRAVGFFSTPSSFSRIVPRMSRFRPSPPPFIEMLLILYLSRPPFCHMRICFCSFLRNPYTPWIFGKSVQSYNIKFLSLCMCVEYN